jgi:hypothetical protein
MTTETPPVEEDDDRVELCYTPEQLTIRALVDALDQRVLHIKVEE